MSTPPQSSRAPGRPPLGSLAHPALAPKRRGAVLRYLWPYRLGIALGVLLLLLTNVMAQAIPWVVKLTIDRARAGARPGAIMLLAGAVALLAVLQAVTRIPSRIFVFNAARDAEYTLRREVFDQLCHAGAAFYRTFKTGDLMSRLTNDLSAVRGIYGPGVLHVVNTVFAYGVALPLMLRIDWALASLALAPYPLLLFGTRFFARGIYYRSQRMQEELAEMTSEVQESLVGIREIKNYRLEQMRGDRMAAVSARYLDEAIRLARWRAGFIPFIGLGSGASLVVVLWFGGSRVLAGHLSLGDLVAVHLYVGLLAWPTMSIGWILQVWQRGVASWDRLMQLQAESQATVVGSRAADAEAASSPADHGPDSVPSRPQAHVRLAVRGLTVRLGQTVALDQVTLDAEPGTICGVVGPVGAGKTTLFEVLARLLDVPRGTYIVNGTDVLDRSVAHIRSCIAYAPQQAFLFSATVRANIRFGIDRADTQGEEEIVARITQAARAAGLEPDLAAFPHGLETVVGERGLSVSGGQRQRIALARALVSSRPVLLLDDALSAVDANTEREILASLDHVVAGKTVLLSSHRLSALMRTDKVFVLVDGKIAESGHPKALLEHDGAYATLYRSQLRDLGVPQGEVR